jgi:hypothetical protein
LEVGKSKRGGIWMRRKLGEAGFGEGGGLEFNIKQNHGVLHMTGAFEFVGGGI